jgi:hypothetical protein
MRQGAMTTTQTGLIAASEHLGTLTAVLYPRLKTEAAPQFASLAGGKAVKVTSAAGTDYVFLSATPFKYSEDDIDFEGTAGLVKMRGAKTTVVLGADGTLSARGKTVTKGEPHPAGIKQEPYNQVANGDFENGKQDLFLEPPATGAIALSIFDGNPVAGDQSPGKKCLAITFKQAGGGALSANTRWGMDTSKKYKFSVRVYTAAKMQATIGGYASSKTSSQVRDANGRVWQWSLGIKGPTKGWQTFETTIGPAGSGAAAIWPANARITGFAMWPSSEKGTIYMDDFKFVEMDDK